MSLHPPNSLRSFQHEARAQSPLPRAYKVPPLVQAQWQPSDMACVFKGNSAAALSRALCEAYGVRHCLLVDSARSGLFLLAKALGLDGEWLFTSFGYRPMTLLIKQIAAKMAFADINDDFNMDPVSAQKAIGPDTEVMLVNHMFGRCADIKALRALADRHGLFLIENAVHVSPSLQAEGRKAGSWGDASLLSFNLDKPLGALAGGAVLTNRDDVWEAINRISLKQPPALRVAGRVLTSLLAYQYKPLLTRIAPARMFRNEDAVSKIEAISGAEYLDYKPSSMTRTQAGVALECLRRNQGMQVRRTRNAERLVSMIDNKKDSLVLPVSNLAAPNSWLYFPIIFRELSRIDAGRAYARAGIETKWRYYPLHLQAEFAGSRYDNLENTETLAQQYLLLPAGSCDTEEQVDYVAESTNRIVRELSTP